MTERRRAVLTIGGTLIVGILIGVLIMSLLARQHYRGDKSHSKGDRNHNGSDRNRSGSRGHSESRNRDGFLDKVAHVTDATAEQKEKMKPFVKEAISQIDSLQEHSETEVIGIMSKLKLKLSKVLSPEQIEKFDKFHKQKMESREHR